MHCSACMHRANTSSQLQSRSLYPQDPACMQGSLHTPYLALSACAPGWAAVCATSLLVSSLSGSDSTCTRKLPLPPAASADVFCTDRSTLPEAGTEAAGREGTHIMRCKQQDIPLEAQTRQNTPMPVPALSWVKLVVTSKSTQPLQHPCHAMPSLPGICTTMRCCL